MELMRRKLEEACIQYLTG
uniref:Uncharacterized protein n=1 Tax=Arundo donax TaxID=35708 RepID=A0A0A8YCX3_ARUDO